MLKNLLYGFYDIWLRPFEDKEFAAFGIGIWATTILGVAMTIFLIVW